VIEETDTGRHIDLLLVDSRYNVERERASNARFGGLTRHGGRSDWVGHGVWVRLGVTFGNPEQLQSQLGNARYISFESYWSSSWLKAIHRSRDSQSLS